ncbi:MAG: hypothetical protein HY298_16955 [Verrucomicrobia bacterium]|nr:hypothetical protein [Verrucomicrobiota bacterium]
MNRFSKNRLFLGSIAGVLACIYVYFYNQIGILRTDKETEVLNQITAYYLRFQWCALIIPLAGFFFLARFQTLRRRLRLSVYPELLFIFAVGWIFMSIIIWELQRANAPIRLRRLLDQEKEMTHPENMAPAENNPSK